MPQKPNRKDMQPYVASGEHGGEYTDYKAGTPYSPGYKPKKKGETSKEPIIKTPDKEDEDRPQGRQVGDNYNKVNSYIGEKANATYNKAQREFIQNFTKGCDDRCNELLSYAQEKTGVKYKVGHGVCQYSFSWYDNKKSNFIVRLDKESLTEQAENDSYGMGGVFYHENGHLLDFTGNYSRDFKSEKYGKTLGDVIKEELSDRARDIYKELISKKNDIEQEELGKVNQQQIDEYNNASQELKNLRDKYLEYKNKERDKFMDGSISFQKYAEWYDQAEKLDAQFKNSDQYKKASAVIDKIGGDPTVRAKLNAHNRFNRDYGDISDMLDSVGYRITMGHGMRYWRDRDNRSAEFFAEAFKTKATGIGKLLEYFPKSGEVFEEILRSIK